MALTGKEREAKLFRDATFIFIRNHGNELPKELYSWQVFLTKKDALRWLMLYNYNLEDYNIVEYNKDDIEDWSVVDLFI